MRKLTVPHRESEGNALADAQVNLFPNSFESHPAATLTLVQALEAIRTDAYQSKVDRVPQVLARQGKRAYDRAKAFLPALTLAGTFAPSRGIPYLQQHSGIVHDDLDHLLDVVAISWLSHTTHRRGPKMPRQRIPIIRCQLPEILRQRRKNDHGNSPPKTFTPITRGRHSLGMTRTNPHTYQAEGGADF